jgi:hypothetical protein
MHAQCSIESGPPKELAEYIQTTRSELQSINTRYPNICTKTPSPNTNLDRLLSVIDRANNQVPLMNNIIVDFSYNVLTVARLESSPIVIRHGKLLYDLEKSSIIPTIESLANKCQLDGPAAGELVAILKKNNEIQDFFKNTVLGNISTANTPLEQSILSNYSEAATQSCKDNLDLSVWVESIVRKSEWFGKDISEARDHWDQALRLIQGGSARWTKSYNKLQTRLLRQELSRQWVWRNAMQQMLTNLECAQAKSDEKNNIESQSIATEQCKKNYIIGLEKLNNTLNNVRGKSKTSDEYIQLTEKNAQKLTQEVDILTLYSTLQSSIKSQNNADATTNTIITNLMNMHTNLVWINRAIEKRIPKMKENCMKWSPDIVGWC